MENWTWGSLPLWFKGTGEEKHWKDWKKYEHLPSSGIVCCHNLNPFISTMFGTHEIITKLHQKTGTKVSHHGPWKGKGKGWTLDLCATLLAPPYEYNEVTQIREIRCARRPNWDMFLTILHNSKLPFLIAYFDKLQGLELRKQEVNQWFKDDSCVEQICGSCAVIHIVYRSI